jgi:hypothetical protein
MRDTLLRGLLVVSVSLGAVASGACDPVPLGDGHFWDSGPGPLNRQPDPVLPPDSGSPDPEDADIPPLGTGGSTGTGGSSESGGSTGTGGSGETGGSTETGGTGIGGSTRSGGSGGSALGGRTGSGGNMGSGGANGSGGRAASGGSNGTGGSTTGTGTGMTGTLKVSVTTKAAGGQYQPRNVGAIWIADSGNKFVKSLYVWAQQRRSYLKNWGSATSAAGKSNNVVDAVTSATIGSHGTRTAMWNGTDTNKALVPDGAYKVCFELCDGGSPQYQCVDFNKSRTAQTLSPANTSSFTSRSIGYTP